MSECIEPRTDDACTAVAAEVNEAKEESPIVTTRNEPLNDNLSMKDTFMISFFERRQRLTLLSSQIKITCVLIYFIWYATC